MIEVIRNVEWVHADTKKTIFEYLHPVANEWRMRVINGFFEKEELEKQYFDEIKK
jgi:hypothetical protein